ncbi:MobQ family relaxase [Acidisoma cladoniae]|uniref:MobQ family relaxase n=1 Tax=Acidisoma cladoniae TaxID=3040935 RepID=UPI00254C1090|nr:MobQ family relaxase [Acidisoma sp. PAMC 29798]
MASAHLNRTFVKRSQGESATGKAAYNARDRIYDERTGDVHDYTRHRSKCIFEGLYVPKDAPEWAADRSELWNRAEAAEVRKDAQVGQSFDGALPHELTDEQNRWLLQDFVRENFTRKGLAADVSIHAPSKGMDDRNVHAHILVSERVLGPDGFAKSKPQKSRADVTAETKAFRKSWETLVNRHLERHGHEARIDMGRTRDGDSLHMGKAAKGMEARGVQTDRGDIQREADQLTQARAEVAELESLQRDAFRRQDRERAGVMWDGEYTSTLDGIRQREAAEKNNSSDAQAKRALDDLAAVDPLGTARHFGHHRGDQLKTPEEMRRDMAARMRAFDEPEQAAGRERDSRENPAHGNPAQDPTAAKSERGWTAQGGGWDGLTPEHQAQARQSWEAWTEKRTASGKGFGLSDYVDYVQEREAAKMARAGAKPESQAHQVKQPAPTDDLERPTRERTTKDSQAKRPDPADERAAWAATLRGFAEEGPQKVTRGPEPVTAGEDPANVRERTYERERARPGASYLQAALSAARERLNSLGARLEATLTHIQVRLRDREAATTVRLGGHASTSPSPRHTRENTSSRENNRTMAEELRQAGKEAARQERVVPDEEQVRKLERQIEAAKMRGDKEALRGLGKEHFRQTGTGGKSVEAGPESPKKDFMDELMEQARKAVAENEAREIGRRHESEGNEVERIRELIRQERQARRPHEPS